MKIVLSTKITPYNKDFSYKPLTSQWYIKNTGKTQIFINEIYPLPNYGSFGVDSSEFLQPKIAGILKGKKLDLKIVDESQYRVQFTDIQLLVFSNQLAYQQAMIVETSIKIVR
jgi:hypothetical protein